MIWESFSKGLPGLPTSPKASPIILVFSRTYSTRVPRFARALCSYCVPTRFRLALLLGFTLVFKSERRRNFLVLLKVNTGINYSVVWSNSPSNTWVISFRFPSKITHLIRRDRYAFSFDYWIQSLVRYNASDIRDQSDTSTDWCFLSILNFSCNIEHLSWVFSEISEWIYFQIWVSD